jgi:N-acetylglutamate synthase-like GNAT family acetyltransferase
MVVIRRGGQGDQEAIAAIINEAAQAYRGVIPVDRWHEPYMSIQELKREIADGVVFWMAEEGGRLLGVMGIQDKGDVALVRHAYVAPATQRSGVGTRLLRHVQGLADKPILIGTWATASWAIAFVYVAAAGCAVAGATLGSFRPNSRCSSHRFTTSWIVTEATEMYHTCRSWNPGCCATA